MHSIDLHGYVVLLFSDFSQKSESTDLPEWRRAAYSDATAKLLQYYCPATTDYALHSLDWDFFKRFVYSIHSKLKLWHSMLALTAFHATMTNNAFLQMKLLPTSRLLMVKSHWISGSPLVIVIHISLSLQFDICLFPVFLWMRSGALVDILLLMHRSVKTLLTSI